MIQNWAPQQNLGLLKMLQAQNQGQGQSPMNIMALLALLQHRQRQQKYRESRTDGRTTRVSGYV
jgi:hypothetical protein